MILILLEDTKYWLPNCLFGAKVFGRQVFPTVDVHIYSEYGAICGFDVKHGSRKLFDMSEDVKSKRL